MSGSLAAVAIGALLLGACGDDGIDATTANPVSTTSIEQTNGTENVYVLTGSITIQHADGLSHIPEGSRIVVSLEDVSLLDMASTLIAEQVIEDVASLPTDYTVEWQGDLDPTRDYTISAAVYNGDELIFWTDTAFPVGPSDVAVDFFVVAATSEMAGEETVTGEIVGVVDGTDGSTVELATADGTTVFATVSIPNLGPDTEFDFGALAVGHTITVVGETFVMDGDTHLTARTASAS